MIRDLLRRLFKAAPAPVPPPRAVPVFWKAQGLGELAEQLLAMPDPDVILKAAGVKRHDLRKLTFDDEIYQALSTREEGLMIVPVRLEPTESEQSKFITSRCLTPEIVRTLVSGAFKAKLYGYSVMEIIWDKEAWGKEGVFVPLDISLRAMERFVIRPDGTLVQLASGSAAGLEGDPALQKKIAGLPGAAGMAAVMDTRYKFLLTRNEPTWDNPYGEALLSRLWWPWFFRQKAWNFYGQYLERFAIPMLVGTGEDLEAIAAALARAQQDAVIAVHTGDEVNSLSANGSGHELYSGMEEMIVRRIEKVVLGQTLTSGTDGGSGNRALGQVHNSVRADKTKADVELVRPTVQRYVDACFVLNGMKGDIPEVIFGDDRQLAEDRAARDAVLKQAGIVAGYSEDYLMDNYGFRPGEIEMPVPWEPPVPQIPPQDGEEEDDELPPDELPPGEGDDAPEMKASAGGATFAMEESVDLRIEALALWGAKRAGNPIDPDSIKAAILESDSPGEMLRRLGELEMRPGFAERLYKVKRAGIGIGGELARDA
ncbi:MAG: DUF935 domain-containing protein [Deltaproteobacteria bacterium]|nr:DUF935 domain-containing protein [Deltaproteobacteria bacterium]